MCLFQRLHPELPHPWKLFARFEAFGTIKILRKHDWIFMSWDRLLTKLTYKFIISVPERFFQCLLDFWTLFGWEEKSFGRERCKFHSVTPNKQFQEPTTLGWFAFCVKEMVYPASITILGGWMPLLLPRRVKLICLRDHWELIPCCLQNLKRMS